MKQSFFFYAFGLVGLIAFTGAIFCNAPHQFFTATLCAFICATIYQSKNIKNGKSN
jgi:hypothetical protein